MKIIALESNNVKRLKAVEIHPDGSLVIVGGNNGQGKSSVLDSIMFALGGKGSLPPEPVRHGESQARVKLDIGDFVIERRINPDRSGTLKITGADGGKHGQALADRLLSSISLDPVEFLRLPAKEQAETLRRLVGLDFSALDAARAASFGERTDINRETKRLEAQVQAIPHDPTAPESEVSAAEISRELASAHEANRIADQANRMAWDARSKVERIQSEVDDFKRRLADAENRLKLATEDHLKAEDAASQAAKIETAPIEQRLADVESENRRWRSASDRARLVESAKKSATEAEALTAKLASIDAEKGKMLSSAKMPVDGLSFSDEGLILLNGVPLSQASSAERLRLSVAMAIALAPELRVILIRDGSLLDAANLAIIGEMAAQHDAQVWVERVGDHDAGAIIIEDGSVKPGNA